MPTKKSTLEKKSHPRAKTGVKKTAPAKPKATEAPKEAPQELKQVKQKPVEQTLSLKIKIKAFDYKTVDLVSQKIIDNALRLNANIKGPIPLPTEFKRVSINRSTFVHKQSGDQFEMRIHKRIIYIVNPKPELANSLSQISIPRGVEIEISY